MNNELASSMGVNGLLSASKSFTIHGDPPYYPTMDKLLVEPERADEKTAGGVFLPDASRDKPQVSRIIRWGPVVAKFLPSVASEERVLHSKYSGTELLYKNARYLIIAAKDILAFERDE